ncbi:regucalcin-like [Pomacea canaliculata]|uniref:regucalcin-like n=1 Tax=Pomacea canaliculata TaxID=400727 RepID=UPI000D729D09|nr:regucalcin-like [Pomacea canaliculata]XP_025110661.1 regucalcin-like [Pomacea canaliculata]
MLSLRVEVAIRNGAKHLAEGPHWDEDTQTLLYVDLTGHEVHRWNPVTKEDTKVTLDDNVTFVIPRRQGGLMVGLGRTISQLDWDSQTVTKIVEVDQGTNNRFNDGKCDAKGRLWAGTMGSNPNPPAPPQGSLYSLGLDRTVRKQATNFYLSNGLAWTDDNQTMFFIDSPARKLYAFDFDLEGGNISNQRAAIDMATAAPDIGGVPDGMNIDTEGKLWVAFYDGGVIGRFDPVTGTHLQTLKFPVTQVTSMCWGGRNHDELYVTSGRQGHPRSTSSEKNHWLDPFSGLQARGIKVAQPTYMRVDRPVPSFRRYPKKLEITTWVAVINKT